jgi:NADPH-dependent curcumin reductase CurA
LALANYDSRGAGEYDNRGSAVWWSAESSIFYGFAFVNRYWRLDRNPVAQDFGAAMSLQCEPVPQPANGQILIRNQYLSMDAGTRMWMTSRTDGYQPPLPLGSPMSGLVLGQVAESRHPGFALGQWVRAFGTWSDFSCVDPLLAGAFVVDPHVDDMRQHFGVLGMNGWTALWGVRETGVVKAGETVLVSAAAGATGLLACQIAKLLNCRVIGIAGGTEKCTYLTEEVGIDGAVDYKAGDVAEQLSAFGGIDVYFDNVGGPILDNVLLAMNHYGRIAICGLVSDYSGGSGRTSPGNFDQILMRRLRVEGFFSPDFMNQGERLTAELRKWLDEGQIAMPFDVTRGLENTLNAYARMLGGGNIGKVIVELKQ